MTFSPKAFLVLVGFAVVLLLAVSARNGHVDPGFAMAGVISVVLIEGLFTPLGHALLNRARHRG